MNIALSFLSPVDMGSLPLSSARSNVNGRDKNSAMMVSGIPDGRLSILAARLYGDDDGAVLSNHPLVCGKSAWVCPAVWLPPAKVFGGGAFGSLLSLRPQLRVGSRRWPALLTPFLFAAFSDILVQQKLLGAIQPAFPGERPNALRAL